MNATEFKKAWMTDASERWCEFPNDQLEKSNLKEETKAFLSIGFPEDAAPFLGFGWRSYEGQFHSIHSYYKDDALDEKFKNYWIIGADNQGNPICIDASDDDKIVLLDHEQDFELLEYMNTNISELAASLLIFRTFIERVNKAFGEDAFLESSYTYGIRK